MGCLYEIEFMGLSSLPFSHTSLTRTAADEGDCGKSAAPRNGTQHLGYDALPAAAMPQAARAPPQTRAFGVRAFWVFQAITVQAIPSTSARINNKLIPFCQWIMMATQLLCKRWATNGMITQMGSSANNCHG